MKKNLTNNFFFKFLFFVGFLVIPISLFAQTVTNLGGFATVFNNLFNVLVSLIITAGLIVFLWGVSKFIRSGDNEQERKSAREFMVWGIITLFVMISVWGLVTVVLDTFGITDTGLVKLSPP